MTEQTSHTVVNCELW